MPRHFAEVPLASPFKPYPGFNYEIDRVRFWIDTDARQLQAGIVVNNVSSRPSTIKSLGIVIEEPNKSNLLDFSIELPTASPRTGNYYVLRHTVPTNPTEQRRWYRGREATLYFTQTSEQYRPRSGRPFSYPRNINNPEQLTLVVFEQ